jgi:DNA-binding GntR family transcriptional regulator
MDNRTQPAASAGDHPDPRAYTLIARVLRADIAAGKLAPGDRLAIGELQARFGGARQTTGRALRLLEREGLLWRVPGHGYHVTQDAPAKAASAQEPES